MKTAAKKHKGLPRILKIFYILAVIFALIWLEGGFCASTENYSYSDESILVKVKVGMTMEVEFPDKIANVAKSLPTDSLQIETLGNRMFLLPQKEIDTVIYIVTQDNVSYCLRLITDETQNSTHLKLKKPLNKDTEPKNKDAANTVELMRTLILGGNPSSSVSFELGKREVFNNGTLRIVINETYELKGGVRALVLTFENLTDKPLCVPIQYIELPGLLAISADSQILEARSSGKDKKESNYFTKAYMVIEEPRV